MFTGNPDVAGSPDAVLQTVLIRIAVLKKGKKNPKDPEGNPEIEAAGELSGLLGCLLTHPVIH